MDSIPSKPKNWRSCYKLFSLMHEQLRFSIYTHESNNSGVVPQSSCSSLYIFYNVPKGGRLILFLVQWVINHWLREFTTNRKEISEFIEYGYKLLETKDLNVLTNFFSKILGEERFVIGQKRIDPLWWINWLISQVY